MGAASGGVPGVIAPRNTGRVRPLICGCLSRPTSLIANINTAAKFSQRNGTIVANCNLAESGKLPVGIDNVEDNIFGMKKNFFNLETERDEQGFRYEFLRFDFGPGDTTLKANGMRHSGAHSQNLPFLYTFELLKL